MESKCAAALRPGAQAGKPVGGFAFVSVSNILRVWSAYQAGVVKLRDVRVWFAAHEVLARRCELEEGRLPRFRLEELQKLVGGGAVKGSIRRLEASKLLDWSETLLRFPNATAAELTALAGLPVFSLVQNNRRLLPVPRSALKLLAQGTGAVMATLLGQLLRCVYYRDGQVVSWGRCKSSWVADVFGLTLRSVKAARKHLLGLGWLVELGSTWSERQRWGGTFAVSLNFAFARPAAYADTAGPVPDMCPTRAAAVVPTSDNSPRPAVFEPVFSPPYVNRELPSELKNQKPASGGRTGFCSEELKSRKAAGEAAVAVAAAAVKPPTWKHVDPRDLRDTPRLLELYEQAVAAGDLGRSEANRIRFVTAAEHAAVKGTANPCGLFVHLVKGKLWHYATESDEEAARLRLNRTLFGVSRERPPEPPKPKRKRVELSDDARFAHAVDAVSTQKGIPPMVIVRQMRPDWTAERYEAALAEAEESRLKQLA